MLSTLKMHDVPEVRQGFLRTCQDAVALAGRESARDGAAYRALLLQVSQAVAQAGQGRGLPGPGGVQVSGKEQDALEELRQGPGRGAPGAAPGERAPELPRAPRKAREARLRLHRRPPPPETVQALVEEAHARFSPRRGRAAGDRATAARAPPAVGTPGRPGG